jgi:hypothetical protein
LGSACEASLEAAEKLLEKPRLRDPKQSRFEALFEADFAPISRPVFWPAPGGAQTRETRPSTTWNSARSADEKVPLRNSSGRVVVTKI